VIAFGGKGYEARIAEIINAAYDAGEAGIWESGWKRMSVEGVERLVAAGEIAVAWQDGEPVGCIRIRRLDDGAGMFGMLSVDPVAHGTGLGKALIAFAEATYPDADEMELELLIPRAALHPHKQRLHEWYSRLGYVQIGRRDFVEPGLAGPADLWVYRKNLRPTPVDSS
jgi:GNAT superfamily N-acetyltransferase